MRQLRLLLIFLIGIFLFGAGAVGGYIYWLRSPVGPQDQDLKAFVVPRGSNIIQIAQKLEQEGLIRSSLGFRLWTRWRYPELQIEAGDYKLSPSMNIDQIINSLQHGAVDRWVTLIEGWRVEEIAERLHDVMGIDREQFIQIAKPYEGYLFPDTYLINPESSVEDIVRRLRSNFRQKYTPELQEKIKTQGLTPEQGVILASLVEREGRSDKVRTEIASILLKRLKMGMKLDVDATVQYALGYQPSEQSWWKRRLTNDDLQTNSPYNTYLNLGLPPTPISNPSLSSLTAVANADPSTPYLYYYHDSQGNSHYATTLDEHNQNIANNP